MSRAAERRAARLARKEARLAAKAARQAARQAARTDRAAGRQEVRSVAYETGNNPNAFISDIVSTVGATAVGLKGTPQGGFASDPQAAAKRGGGGSDFVEDLKDNPLKAAGIALLLGFVAKRAGIF